MIICGLLLYLALFSIFLIPKNVSLRENFLYSAILWGALIYCATEVLSLFNALAASNLLLFWMMVVLICLGTAFKKGIKLHFPTLSLGLFVIITLTLIPLTIGLVYPPNNWDSMTYHLPKIEHWLQNLSVASYPTSIDRQNDLVPFTEYSILQVRALSGSDILDNSVQWLAYVGCISNISFIAACLGAQKRGQFLAALFCVAIPMAILQASSTQTDLYTSWWLSCMAALLFILNEKFSPAPAAAFGVALGLACFSKGTAYAMGWPLVLAFTVMTLRHCTRKKFACALAAAIIALCINLPFYIYNIKTYSTPVFSPTANLTSYTPRLNYFFANCLYNILTNIEVPTIQSFHNRVTAVTHKALTAIGVKSEDRPNFSFSNTDFATRSVFSTHEDTAQNTLCMLVLLIVFPLALFRGSRNLRFYALLVLCGGLTFCALIRWQPWITRLQLPFFVLAAPIVGLLCTKTRIFITLVVLLLVSAAVSNIFNQSRRILNSDLILALMPNRQYAYFYSKGHKFRADYQDAVAKIEPNTRIGLIIDGDSWEYPLWAILRERKSHNRIFHITKPEDIAKVDIIFMLDSTERFGIKRPENINPYVEKRITDKKN